MKYQPLFHSVRERWRFLLQSYTFSFRGESWYFEIFPNGWSAVHSSGHIDLRLRKFSCYSPNYSIRQVYSFSLKNVKNEKYNEEYGTAHFERRILHAINLFIPRSELSKKRSELVPGGILTVVCTMKDTTSAGSVREVLEQNSENICVEACTQTEEEEKAENICEETSTQTEDENAENICEETSTQTEEENAENICEETSTQTEEENAVKGLDQNPEIIRLEACTQTVEENAGNIFVEASTQTVEEKAVGLFEEKSRSACIDAFTQTEEQNERVKELSIPELKKADTSEVALSDETTVSNQTVANETKEPISLIRVLKERDLVTDVNDLLKERRGVDVTFEMEPPTGKIEVFAHQLILALRSPYFADLFYGEGSNKGHQVIPLKGINTKAFEQMIKYCYDYKSCMKTIQDACALFEVAFEFKMISLLNVCYTFVRYTKIEPRNVFSILKISEIMGDKSLQDMCYKIMQEQTRDVMAAYELIDVTPAMVHTFLNLPKLSLNSEYELIKWLFDWAKLKFIDSSSKNAREYLEKFLKGMNFLALRFEEFATLCKDNQEFFNPDEIGNISMNIAFPGTREMPDWYGKDLKCRVYTGSKK